MRIESQKISTRQFFITVAAITLGVFAGGAIPHVQAAPTSDERLITIHDRGEEKGLITHASSLRDVFKEAKIVLDKNDMVEPGLDEELLGNNYQVNIYRARPLVIIDGNTKQLVMTAYQTPKQIAKHAGIILHDEDDASIQLTNDLLTDGASERMVVDRASAIKLTLYGKTDTVYTQKLTVSEFLKEKDITLAKNDTLSVRPTALIKDGMKIELWHNGKQTVTKAEKIEPPIRQIQDANREVGYRKVKTVGQPGKKIVTYVIVMKNGKQVSRKVTQTVIVKKATEQVEVVGTKLKNSFSGDFAGALSRLRSCEGSYSSNTGNGYYGAYQYDLGTWGGYKGYPHAAAAPANVQDEKAWITYQARGWSPWPSCSISQGLQDIYR